MKKILVMTVALMAMFAQANAQRVKGSDTVLPLSQKEAESYLKSHPNESLTVTGGGSGVGIAALIAGTTEIAQASRAMKFEEKQKMKAEGRKLKEQVIAYDALAIVVNPANKVTNLTREQLSDIFTGKITNWKEVGGADMKIIPYSRETSSGTYEFFKESVMHKKNYVNGIMSMPATGAIIQSVGQTKGAIGYVGLAYLNKKVKAIHVSYDGGKTFTAPTVANARNKSYPIVRPLYYYYDQASEPKIKSFLTFVLSRAGQKIVSQVGYIPR